MTILERIKQLNEERGWSYYELSKNSNISESTIYSLIRRNKTPSIPVLEKICLAYGITLFQFFKDIVDPTLTDEQNDLLIKWSKLDGDDKKTIMQIIDHIVSIKKK